MGTKVMWEAICGFFATPQTNNNIYKQKWHQKRESHVEGGRGQGLRPVNGSVVKSKDVF
jgi:hypothetical protein